MRYLIFVLVLVLMGPATPVQAQVQTSVGIGVVRHGVRIGFTMSNYPTLVRIPGYPVYYDPYVDFNYFYYDGLYWAYVDDDWYASTWYDGPWDLVSPYDVPLFVLRVPVRYYRRPPPYFRGWRADAPPRWGERWGDEWELRHRGWDRWDHRAVPSAAPLPSYQRFYSGDRYPRAREQQRRIESDPQRFRPRDQVNQQLLEQRRSAPAPFVRERQSLQPQPRQQLPQREQHAPSPRGRSTDHRNGKGHSGQDRDRGRGNDAGGHPG